MAETSDHDLLLRLDERTARIEEYMKERPCPSTLCQEHDRDIERLITTIKIIGILATLVAPIIVTVILYIAEHH